MPEGFEGFQPGYGVGKDTRFSSEYQPEKQGNIKRTKHRSTVVRKWLEVGQQFENPITKELQFLDQEDIITLSMIKAAREGDVQAFKELMDSAYGKATSTLEIGAKTQLEAPPLIVYNTAPPLLDAEPDENEITPHEEVKPNINSNE